MLMRVVLLSHDRSKNIHFLSGLYDALSVKHNVIRVFYDQAIKDDERQCEWGNFDLDGIESFEPDLIIVFNGFAKETCGAISYLKYKYRVMFVERGWFPQEGNIYIDPCGIGASSSLAMRDLSRPKVEDETAQYAVDVLREKHYSYSNSGSDYILVPLQLERDLSIVNDSRYFKTMGSLVQFLSRQLKGQQMIVTPHPLDGGAVGATDKFVPSAKAVIGINSTSMIEALVHYKTVGFLGQSILDSSNVTIPPILTMDKTSSILEHFTPNKVMINHVIYNLLHEQFDMNAVPERVIKALELV